MKRSCGKRAERKRSKNRGVLRKRSRWLGADEKGAEEKEHERSRIMGLGKRSRGK
jgi:hypothetical protein